MKLRVCELAQQVKMPDGKLGNLCSIPVSHPVERERFHLSSDLHGHVWHKYICIYAQISKVSNTKVQNEKNAQMCSQASQIVCISINMYGCFKFNSQNVHSNLCMVKLKRIFIYYLIIGVSYEYFTESIVQTPLKSEGTYLKVHAMTFKINW